jgi:TPR repeat protein
MNVKGDREQALHWYDVSAQDGDVRAMNRLAFSLLSREDDSRSRAEGRIWLVKAAEQGDEEAVERLERLDKQD